MTRRTLVTYATRTGWSPGVAEAIGRTLSEKGLAVDVLPMADVRELTGYGSVVAGSAINAGAWLPEAMQFVRDHQAELAQMPFAAFLVCMTLAMRDGERHRSHVATWLDPVRALVRPVSEGLFAGGLELHRIPSPGVRLKFRISVLFGVWKEGDHRDWEAIRTWASKLKPLLAP